MTLSGSSRLSEPSNSIALELERGDRALDRLGLVDQRRRSTACTTALPAALPSPIIWS